MPFSLIFLAVVCGLLWPAPIEGRITHIGSSQIRQEKCMFVTSAGVCRKKKHYRQYSYDFTTNRCLQFWYSGCGGNPNRFANKEECRKWCLDGGKQPEEDYEYNYN